MGNSEKSSQSYNLFDNLTSFCLTIPERRNHFKDHIKPVAKQHGIDAREFLAGRDIQDGSDLPPRFANSTTYPTWWKTPRPYNAWKAHNAIFRKAKELNLTRVLMMEDDSEFSHDYREVIDSVADFFKENFSPLIYLGSYLQEGRYEMVAPHIARVNGCGGLHGVIIHHSLFDKLINLNPLGPYDDTISRLYHRTYEAYAIVPQVINQKSGFSFIENCNLEKPKRTEA